MDASKPLKRKHCEDHTGSYSSAKLLSGVLLKRKKVEQALVRFRDLFCKLMCQYKEDQLGNLTAKKKARMEAAMVMNRKYQWENTRKRVGHVLGIEVGDHFQCRVELNVIGLHRQYWSGIDFVGTGRKSLATSIVVTERYDNAKISQDSLVYMGQGGNPNVKSNVVVRDQKLIGGNLALKNSMDAKSPVRVVLKVSGSFVYDGLYLVEKMTQARGKFGKLVFMFTLKRILEQPKACVGVGLRDDVMQNDRDLGRFASFFNPNKRHNFNGSAVKKEVVRMNDVSRGKEKFPIRVVTSMDCIQIPSPFEYIVNNIYSERFKHPILHCTNGFECGPSCKCFSSCINNQVSQHGVQFQLEIFMTELKGWGVRTRSFIPSGSVACEYIGEVCRIGSMPDADDYVFDMGCGKGFIDATRCGNIGRFINHSCTPNLYVKDIMYDHNDMSFPHRMFFAVKDIPAGRELSYDYNNTCKGKHGNEMFELTEEVGILELKSY
ncbi:hypothetical protein RJT34_24103 [Clitoria ternatea]|uniref:Uncharacterized protein n=1 Tax=Clitoria ternatea TaxID=43366 RepID=A0AAN9FMF5_CLITE